MLVVGVDEDHRARQRAGVVWARIGPTAIRVIGVTGVRSAIFAAARVRLYAGVWLGQGPSVPLVIERDVLITMTRKARRNMKVTVTYDGPVPAPVTKGDRIATVVITAPGREPLELPLVAGENVSQLGLVGRFGEALKSILWGESG